MAFASGPFDEHLITRGRVDGEGAFSFPDKDPVYHGQVVDGRFHGQGYLLFKDGTKYIATWNQGKPENPRLIFGDGLEYKKTEWAYLTPEDRRYQLEILQGQAPAGKQLEKKK